MPELFERYEKRFKQTGGNKEGKSVENQSRMPKRAEEIQICGNNKEKRKQKRQKQEKNRRFINRFSDF